MVTLVVVALVVVVMSAGLVVGTRTIPFADVVDALFAPTGSANDTVVRELRLPRTVLAAAVGAGLGVAGAVMQAHTRNVLAEPGLFGVNAGAALAVVLGISVGGVVTPAGHVWLAMLGAGVAAALVLGLGASTAGLLPAGALALVGAATAALLGAVTTAVVLLDDSALVGYRSWVLGSVAGRDGGVLAVCGPLLMVGLVAATAHARVLDALALGPDIARSLGVRLGRARLVGVAVVTLLSGAAVAACGPIAFAGLAVPHLARAVTGPRHVTLIPLAGVLGAILLVVADVVGRLLTRPAEVPVGVVMAVLGGIALVVLVTRRPVAA